MDSWFANLAQRWSWHFFMDFFYQNLEKGEFTKLRPETESRSSGNHELWNHEIQGSPVSTYPKGLARTEKSSIFTFEYVNEVWISGILGEHNLRKFYFILHLAGSSFLYVHTTRLETIAIVFGWLSLKHTMVSAQSKVYTARFSALKATTPELLVLSPSCNSSI